jgi:glycosyltransferase involved in cell wall biosynthesis
MFRLEAEAASAKEGKKGDVSSAPIRPPVADVLMTCPLVTIGITAFNAGDTVAHAVASALAQEGVEAEIVAVDDASSDGTAAQLAELAAAYPGRMRVITHTTNRGVAAARNGIIAAARGEFLCFFDDDDVSAPDRVRRQVERLVAYEGEFAHGAPVVCHAARRQLYPDGETILAPTMGEALDSAAPAGLPVARRILLGTPLQGGYGALATCSQLGRTATYRALGGFDESFQRGEDTDFSIRLAKTGAHFAGVSEPLVTQHMTRSADKSLEDDRNTMLQLIDKHGDVFANEGQRAFARAFVELKQAWLRGRRGTALGRLLAIGLLHPALSAQRLGFALRGLGANRAHRRFHLGDAN